MDVPDHGHEPVLLNAVMELLSPRSGQLALDCTLGRGGHASKIAKAIYPGGQVLCVDVDPKNLKYARQRLAEYGESCRYFHANFAEVGDVLRAAGFTRTDILLADLGVSTNQMIESAHGLSFSVDSPLDMRLDPRLERTAADMVAQLPEKELADLIYRYSEERFSRRIARRIVEARKITPIRTTRQLAELVRQVAPAGFGHGRIDPATRTFQALRMAVNGELENLSLLLAQVPGLMNIGGRAAFISFHSGEDRLVKQAMVDWQSAGWCKLLTKKPMVPDEIETAANPRSRSAKLRVAEFVVAVAAQQSGGVQYQSR